MTEVEELTQQLVAERERADYAWRNARTIEAARVEEMRKRDAAEAALKTLGSMINRLVAHGDYDDSRDINGCPEQSAETAQLIAEARALLTPNVK